MTFDNHCGRCGAEIRYVLVGHGAFWVHVDTGTAHSNVGGYHDCNTYLRAVKK